MGKSNIQLHTRDYNIDLPCCQVYNPQFMRFKDGLGVSGTSDTICDDCLEKETGRE